MWHAIIRSETTPQSLRVAPSFCQINDKCRNINKTNTVCRCGEDQSNVEWVWESITDDPVLSRYGTFSDCRREVTFHSVYSSGTAVVRGNVPFLPDHHYYWEVKILTELYGTDVMVGVGSENTNFDHSYHHFCSFLGLDSETYGYSYTGKVFHDGICRTYGCGFGQGVIVGVHLDTWHGTLEFFINRKPLGIAFRDLKKHKLLYPMICSTASQSAVRLIYTMSFPATLLYDCMKTLNISDISKLKKVPGLKKIHERGFWILELASNKKIVDSDDEEECYGNNTLKRSRQSMFPKSSKSKCESYCIKSSINQLFSISSKIGDSEIDCNDKFKDLEENMDCQNVSNIEILRKIHSPLVNDENIQANEEVWLAALEPTTCHNRKRLSSEESEEGVIKFSTRLTTAICDSCNANLAIKIKNKKTPLNKCLQCFYNS